MKIFLFIILSIFYFQKFKIKVKYNKILIYYNKTNNCKLKYKI